MTKKKRAAPKRGAEVKHEADDDEEVDHPLESEDGPAMEEVQEQEETTEVEENNEATDEVMEEKVEEDVPGENVEKKMEGIEGHEKAEEAMEETLVPSMEDTTAAEDLEMANAATAAIEAAVAASDQAAAVAASDQAAAVAAAVAVAQDATPYPTDRDVILGEGSAGHKTNLLLQDIIRLHRVLWKLHEKPIPTLPEQVHGMVDHIIGIVKHGKQLELAGLKDVPKPFMKSVGRFFGKVPETGAWTVLDDESLKSIMTEIILDEFKVDDLGPLTASPYKDLREWMTKVTSNTAAAEFLPEAKDAILLPVDHEAEKMYESQQGNKTLFHLASQLVTSHTNAPDKRVEAALCIMKGLDETLESMESSGNMGEYATTTKSARFLIRDVREDRTVAWDLMDPASAAEFTVIFVFEVFLEKEIHVTDPNSMMFASLGEGEYGGDDDEGGKPSTVPIVEPTDLDVLFGRGGT
jgi:hypothetical protein